MDKRQQSTTSSPLMEQHPILAFFQRMLQRHSWLVKLFLLPETYSFLGAWMAAAWLAEHYFSLLLSSAKRANHLWKIIGYHLSGGAALGVLKGAAYDDLTIFDNILANSLITITVILLFNTLFGLSCRGIFRISFLDDTFKSLSRSAKSQKKTWVKLGIPGIFAFVFFPSTGTGPIVGSIIARLIGLGYWTSILTVLCGSLASVATFGFAADKIGTLVGDKTLSRISLGIILLLLLTAAAVKFRAWYKNRNQTP